MKYYFHKDSDPIGVKTIRKICEEKSIKDFFKKELVDNKKTIIIEDGPCKFFIKLIDGQLFVSKDA